MEPAELDHLLLPLFGDLGPWVSRDELYRECPNHRVTRGQVAAWTASAEDRGLLSSWAEAGLSRLYALTKKGEYVLTD